MPGKVRVSWIHYRLERREGQDAQLIQPKLQKRQQNAPKTTNHAFTPPSGNEAGSMGPGGTLSTAIAVTAAFSRSTIRDPSAVSGNAVASVKPI